MLILIVPIMGCPEPELRGPDAWEEEEEEEQGLKPSRAPRWPQGVGVQWSRRVPVLGDLEVAPCPLGCQPWLGWGGSWAA